MNDKWKGPVAAVASDDRQHWMGNYSGAPAHLLGQVVERLGLVLVYDDLGTKHGELDLDRGVIRINSTLFERLHHNADLNAVEAFTIAHELAHNSLHPWRLQRGIPLGPEHEREAHFYAGVLLMPRRRIQASYEYNAWLNLPADASPWPLVYRLAESYCVSPKAMMVRLQELKKLGPYVQQPASRPPIAGNVIPLRAHNMNSVQACGYKGASK